MYETPFYLPNPFSNFWEISGFQHIHAGAVIADALPTFTHSDWTASYCQEYLVELETRVAQALTSFHVANLEQLPGEAETLCTELQWGLAKPMRWSRSGLKIRRLERERERWLSSGKALVLDRELWKAELNIETDHGSLAILKMSQDGLGSGAHSRSTPCSIRN
jgi:hypothetical protein